MRKISDGEFRRPLNWQSRAIRINVRSAETKVSAMFLNLSRVLVWYDAVFALFGVA